MTALMIWLIGYWFSLGYLMPDDATTRIQRLGVHLILLSSWPIMLGCWLKEQEGRKG